MKKMLIVLLASLIGMLLCSGITLVVAAYPNCCTCENRASGESCECIHADDSGDCETTHNGIWVGNDGCTIPDCEYTCDDGGKCVPEITTIALLATGLICMAGYFRLRRKEE